MRQRNAFNGPAVLTLGFRPFFLLAGVWAPLAMALFVPMIEGGLALPTAFDPIVWHYHEMLFGYVAAAIGGFVLTAVSNWTGRLPVRGLPLLGLVLLWLAGRATIATSTLTGAWLAALIDLLFLAALGGVVLREIVAGKNWRNLPVVLAVGAYFAGNLAIHAESLALLDTGGRAPIFSIAVVVALIVLIGGRIIPSFTRNWLAKRGAAQLPRAFGAFDWVVLVVTLAALAGWTAVPAHPAAGALLAIAAALNLVRLARWRGWATRHEPLLWVLHVGYLWIPIGLALLAAAALVPAVPAILALHGLTIGAIGTMTLAVMSRATLGHSGQALHAGGALTAAFLLVNAAAVLRIAALLWSGLDTPLITTSALAWCTAFLLYLVACGGLLVRAR